MLRAIWVFFVFSGLLCAVLWILEQSGDVTLYWLDRRIETSISVLLGAVSIVAVLTALLYRVFLSVRRAPRNLKNYIEERRRKKGYLALTRGMVAVAAGDAEEARRQVRRADGLLGDPALTLLLSAQTAQLSGDTQAAQSFFSEMQDRAETEFLGIRGQLTQAMKLGDKDRALRLAHEAYKLKPKSEWVALNLFDLQVREKCWSEALNTLSASVKNRLVDDTDAQHRRAVLEHLLGLAATTNENLRQALRHARRSHEQDPTFSPGTVRYAKLLLGAGKNRKAAAAIEKSWGYSPHPDLLEPYLEACDAPNASARLVAVQRLAKINPHHSDSNLAIASMALDAKIWGEARKFLEATLKQKPSAKVYRLMADLAELSDGNSEESRGWLRQATEANPDPAWVCNPCGHVHMEWAETCGKCGNFSGLVWEMPPHAVMPREILKGSIASILEKPVSELSPPSH